MANEKVNEYLEKRKKKLEAEGKTTSVKPLQTTDGPAKGGSFGDSDKVNAYLKKRQERIEKSSYEQKLLERDRIVGKKVAERETKYIRGAEEEKRLADRPKLSDFNRLSGVLNISNAQAALAQRQGGDRNAVPDFMKQITEIQGYREALNALPGMQGRAAAPMEELTELQSYRDALNALVQKDNSERAAKEQAQAFNFGNYLKGALQAGWAGFGSNAMKTLNAWTEPVQEAAVDALQWVSKHTPLPDISDGTANIMKGKPALGGLYDWAVEPAERAAAYAEQESKKGGYWAEIGNQVIQSTIQQAPNVVLTALTGSANLAADLGSQAAGGFGAAVMERARALVTSPSFANSYTQMYGQRFEDAQADGASAYAATLAATITTLMNAAVEAGSGVEDLPFKESGVLEWVVSALEEGREEVVQQVIDQLGQKAYINKDIPWFSMEDENAVINPKTLAENQLIGTLAGGLAGAPAAAINAAGGQQQTAEHFPEWVAPKISDTGAQILMDQNMLGLEEAKTRRGERTWGNYPKFTQEEQAAMQQENERIRRLAQQEAPVRATEALEAAAEANAAASAQAPRQRAVNPAIEQMAQEYGEDAGLFTAHYEGGDETAYKRGFDAMFRAGQSGLPLNMLGGVSDQLTAGMSEATRQAIYTAGRNKAAQTITPGAKNLTTRKLTSEQRTFLRVWDAIGKEYGFEVDLVDDVTGANGAYRSGGRRIVVSAKAAEGAYIQAAGHETVHYLKSVNPEGYNVLEDVVLGYLKDSGFDVENAVSARMKQYARQNLTREKAIEEIVAEAVPTFFADKAAVQAFAAENRTLAEKIRDFFYKFVEKVREIAERYATSQNRDEIRAIIGNTEALTEIAKTLDTALREAQEKAGEAKGDGEIRTSESRIKRDDVDKLRGIGQKSIANFTSEEIRLTQSWAEKFQKELGVKSPYFRAWFGDWRENDTGAVTISELQIGNEIPRGKYANKDTGWDVAVSSVGINDTVAHSNKDNISVYALSGVDKLIENAVLLDTEASVPRGKKKDNTAFMHKMYAPFTLDEKAYIAKLTVEEVWDNRDDTLKRLYNLRAIETASADAYSGFAGNADHSTTSTKAAGYSVADLFADVKKVDKDFNYAGKSSAIVNADGTPKIVYHQTASDFTVFSNAKPEAGLNDSETPNGYFFKDNDHDIGLDGHKQMAVYLSAQNMLHFSDRKEANQWYRKHIDGYDELSQEYDREMAEFTAKLEDIEDQMFADAEDERYDELSAAEDELLEQMRVVEDEYRARLRKLLDGYFLTGNSEYDGIELDYDGHRWVNGKRENVHTYIVFKPTQIKSATDNVGAYDPENPDIRYSLKTEEQKVREKADREEKKQVREAQAEDWKQVSTGEIMVKDLKVDEETVRRQAAGALNKGLKDKLTQQIGIAANRILRDTESKYGRNELKEKLSQIVKQYAAHGNAALMAEELAGAIIEKSVRLTESEAAEQYADAREKLRNAKISLTDVQKQEVAHEYGSVDAYRKAVFGTVNVRNEGVTLESLWAELSGLYPEVFPPETNEAQMPGVIAQFDRMMKPRYENIYGMDTAAAVTDLALRIQGDVLGMVGAKQAAHDLYGTADKFRNQIRKEYDAEIRAQQKARVDEFQRIAGKLKAAKDKGDSVEQKKIMAEYRRALKKVDVKTAISEVRAAEKVRYEQRTETHERAQLREKVTKRANELMDMLAGRKKGKRVPTVLQGLVMDVLGALDVNGQRAAEAFKETKQAAEFREKLTGIKNFYAQVWDSQSKGESPEGLDGLMMTISERNMAEMTEALEVLGSGEAFYLRDMDSKQLKSLDALLKNVKHTVDSIGKLWRIQRYESIIELGDQSIAEMDSRGEQKINEATAAGKTRDFFALDMMEPVSYGERLGEAGQEIIQGLLDGEKEKFGKIREASEATKRMLKEVGVTSRDIGKWKKHVQTVELGGKKVKMTDAMLMSLYLTAKRPQGRQHLLANGMRLPTTKETGAQVFTVQLTEEDFKRVYVILLGKKRDMADKMGNYLSTTVAKWGNDVTQRMYLYDAFTEKNYWPITSDSNVLKTQEPEGERAFNAIINAGFTKPVNQKATSAVIVQDAFDVFGGHIGEMASYAGYAEVMTDTLAWLNYKKRDSETKLIEGSVKESMEKLLGKGGIRYLTKLVQDINGARRGGDNVQLNKLLGNYKKAAVMGKIRVAIQQPTSIVRAAAEINPVYLLKAMRFTKGLDMSGGFVNWLKSNKTIEEMQKWSNLAWWKANGNYEIGVGKGTDEILWGKTSMGDVVMDKIATQGGLVDPGKMDDWAWAHMWLAVKDEISRKRKDLKVGSDEYFRAVAERFEYIMDRTQVVDTVMHRSDLMRSKDGMNKMLTSFMGEPTKSYNMLMRAVMEAGRNPKSAGSYKKLGRSMLTFAASAAATAAMTALYDAFRYRDDEDEIWTYLESRYWGDVWEQFLKAFVSNVNPIETVAGVKDVYDMVVNDGDVPTIMAFEGISDAVYAVQTVMNYFNGNNSRKSTVYGAIKPVLTAASTMLGLPVSGILTNVETVGRVFDPKWMQTKSEYATQGKAYEKLYKAIVEGQTNKAKEIRTQLSKGLYGANPKTPKEIDSGIARNLALDDERILRYWQMREKGNQYKEMVALRKEIQKDGFTEEHVVYAGNIVESQLTNQYRQLMEDGKNAEAKELKEYAAKYGMTLEEAVAKDMTEELDPKTFQYDHLFAAIRNGDMDDVEGVAGVMELESDAEDPEKAIRNQVSSEFREEYIEAVRGGDARKVNDLDKKLDYFGIDEEDRVQWAKDDRYDDLGEALNAGNTTKADKYVAELRESGVSDEGIASSVRSRFKQTYIDLVVNGDDDEAEELYEMLNGLGLVTDKKKENYFTRKKMDKWVEDWEKAQKD